MYQPQKEVNGGESPAESPPSTVVTRIPILFRYPFEHCTPAIDSAGTEVPYFIRIPYLDFSRLTSDRYMNDALWNSSIKTESNEGKPEIDKRSAANVSKEPGYS